MTALEVRELSVSFGGILAVADVSFAVEEGQVVGLIGPNGAGKTTTIDALSGFVSYAEGAIRLGGRNIDALKPHARARAGLVRTFQSVELFDDLTVRENLLVAAVANPWWAPLLDAVAPRRRARHVDVDAALDVVGLTETATARPPELSHGQRRLVGVARAIAAQPRVLLLDEPAAGLDPNESRELGTVVRSLPDRGIAVLLVDHDVGLVLDVCDHLIVLDQGSVIASGPPDEVRNDPAVVAAYFGEMR